jgi:drug/metabolite transporter (DMT)-like permease
MSSHKIGPLNWFILFFLGGIWGSSFILLKIGARSFDTTEIATLRMFFASVLMIPFLWDVLKKYDRKIWMWMLISALLGSGIPSFFYAYSASRMDSNINGVINSLTPIFTMVVGIVWLRYRTSRLSMLGVMIGFMGVIILITQKGTTLNQSQYAIFPLLATMMYGVNMNVVKVKLAHLPAMDILKGVFGMIGLIFTPIILYFGILKGIDFSYFSFNFWEVAQHADEQKMRSLTALFIVGSIGSLFASYIFYFLVKSTNALFSSMNTYLIPLMAIFWGWMDGEHIGIMHFVSLIVILIGVYLVSKRK